MGKGAPDKSRERDTFLWLAAAALLGAALLYALRARGPARAGDAWVKALCEGVDAPFRAWTALVVHHSATTSGNAAVFDKSHRARGWGGLGYHFVIGAGRGSPAGVVEVGARWRRQEIGAHAKGMNAESVGICLVGDFTEEKPKREQMETLVKLTRYLQKRFHIPASRVFLHREVSKDGTRCPGELFPAQAFRKRLLR